MAKQEQHFTLHFEQARKKVKELGYKHLLDLDQHGTAEHKQLIQSIYRQSHTTHYRDVV